MTGEDEWAALAAAVPSLFHPLQVGVGVSAVGDPVVGEPVVGGEPAQEGTILAGTAGPARRAEFAAGRLAARRALTSFLGSATSLGRAANGAVAWPEEVDGSLAHTRGAAVAIVTGRGYGIGIDLEETGAATASRAALTRSLTEWERADVAAGPAPELAALAAFCAKEAIYKCLPPEVQPGRSFQEVTLRGLSSIGLGCTRLGLAAPTLPKALTAALTVTVCHAGGYLVAGAWYPR